MGGGGRAVASSVLHANPPPGVCCRLEMGWNKEQRLGLWNNVFRLGVFSWWVLSAVSPSLLKGWHAAKNNTTQTDALRNHPVVELVGRDVSRGG